jgi:hypothetical protein
MPPGPAGFPSGNEKFCHSPPALKESVLAHLIFAKAQPPRKKKTVLDYQLLLTAPKLSSFDSQPLTQKSAEYFLTNLAIVRSNLLLFPS